jgi:hypothetical protein
MQRIQFVLPGGRLRSFLLFLLALTAQVPLASATVTYAVGTCEPTLKSFLVIQNENGETGALNATPPPNVVKICPGTYPEQIVISYPVTLEGVPTSTSAQTIISVPSGGLVTNATDSFGDSIAAQVFVSNVKGEVNLTNLTIDGTGNNVTTGSVIGVFYQNSSGTMSHLTTQNQIEAGSLSGSGVSLDGGSNNPSVTLENSNLQLYGETGFFAGTNSTTSELTATVKENYISGNGNMDLPVSGIGFTRGSTVSVIDNLITGGAWMGIFAFPGAQGSISNNVINWASFGINTTADGVSVTANQIYNAIDGIYVASSIAPVTGNVINAQTGPYSGGAGIIFDCIAGENVHSNAVTGEAALYQLPASATSMNIYYNSEFISYAACSSDSPKEAPPSRPMGRHMFSAQPATIPPGGMVFAK